MKRLLPFLYAVVALAFFKFCSFVYVWSHPELPGFISVLKDDNTVATIKIDDFRGIFPSGDDRTIVKTKDGEYIKIQLPYQTVENIYTQARLEVGLNYKEL